MSEAAGQGGGGSWSAGRIALFCIEAGIALTFIVVAVFISKNMIKASMNDANADVKSIPLSEEDAYPGSYDLPPIEILHSREGAEAVQSETAVVHSSDAEVVVSIDDENAPLAKNNESFGTL